MIVVNRNENNGKKSQLESTTTKKMRETEHERKGIKSIFVT